MEALLGAFVVVEGRGVRRDGIHPAGHHRVGHWRRRRIVRRRNSHTNADTDRFGLRDSHGGGGLASRIGIAEANRNRVTNTKRATDGRPDPTADRGTNAGTNATACACGYDAKSQL